MVIVMQIGGIGSELNDHSKYHHVTGCLHDHSVPKKNAGAMQASASHASNAQTSAEPAADIFSLADILKKVQNAGRSLWGHLWGGAVSGDTSAVCENVTNRGEASEAKEQVMAQIGAADLSDKHGPQVAAASSAVQVPRNMLQNNPYFTTTSDSGVIKENIFKKIRVKFRDIADQMTKRFGGRLSGSLSGKSAFRENRRQSKEDLRKCSRYREDGLELDCILTDDSYLLDSYDRKGEYTKLTTRK